MTSRETHPLTANGEKPRMKRAAAKQVLTLSLSPSVGLEWPSALPLEYPRPEDITPPVEIQRTGGGAKKKTSSEAAAARQAPAQGSQKGAACRRALTRLTASRKRPRCFAPLREACIHHLVPNGERQGPAKEAAAAGSAAVSRRRERWRPLMRFGRFRSFLTLAASRRLWSLAGQRRGTIWSLRGRPPLPR